MAVYGHTDLQQYKLEAQLSLLPEVVQAMGMIPPDSTSLICCTFFSHSEMLANSYGVRFAPLVSLCLSCQLPMPSASAPSPPQSESRPTCVQPRERAGSTTLCFCMSTRNWQMVLTWWRSPICLWGTTSGTSNCLGSFKKQPADEVYVCL